MRSVRIAVSLAALLVLAAGRAAGQAAPAPDPKNPQYQSKGEQDRTYAFPGTGESIAYHIYVPAKWNASARLPLVVVTHGANQPATAPFQRPMANPTLAKTAEARGYIVAAVTGYHANATGVPNGMTNYWNVPYAMVQVQRGAAGGGRGGRGAGGGGARGAGGDAAAPTASDFQRAEEDILYVAD